LAILDRFPKRQEITPVYAVICMVLYGWTILWFFWELPGWLFYLTLPEILTNAAYILMTNFVESTILLFGIILLSVLLPGKIFSSAFVSRGVLLGVLGLAYMIYLAFQFGDREDYPTDLVRLMPVVFLLAMAIAFWVGRVSFLRKIIEGFADRAIIFLYFLLPLSLVSVVVVIFRNIF
jgi:hypothetical protein